ncbi:MAG: hypothetical protein GC151_03850 [Betaproteobacteria bacterium]|nr:hypothetical protein [Betaproteobacteria bacterium]
MDFKLTGWKAIAALVVVIAFVAFRFGTRSSAMESQGVEQVRHWLVAESMRAALPRMQAAMDGRQGGDDYLTETAEDLQEKNFEIVSVTTHGLGSRVVARVEVRFKGQPPPDGRNVRYLTMTYSMVTGWIVEREATKWDYYMAVFGSPRST